MAATQALAHADVTLFERRPGAGRKLLIAGSSGLNITHAGPIEDFVPHYRGADPVYWSGLLKEYGPADWISFIEKQIGLETFIGTSERAFVREMKASGLLKRWLGWLEERGVRIETGRELRDFSDAAELRFSDGSAEPFDRAILALGGGSWESTPPLWPELFRKKGFTVEPFLPSNVGFEVAWKEKFLSECEGKPLKSIALETARGSKRGELVVTRTGLEGTPLYFLGVPGDAWLDLKPDLTEAEVLARLQSVRENLSPLRRAKKLLALSEAAQGLLFHHGSTESHADLAVLARTIKHFPLTLLRARPLEEAISSSGGLALSELDLSTHRLKRMPRIACVGEMLNWDAPTGGYLIQACISQGARAGRVSM
jgi:uncharacterized flavoprotein (TIGR03862 family)